MQHKIAVFGVGKIFKMHAHELNYENVVCFIDNNACQDRSLYGKYIIKPDRILEFSFEYVVVFASNNEKVGEIRNQLVAFGIDEESIISWTYYLYVMSNPVRKMSFDAFNGISYAFRELNIETAIDVHSSLLKNELNIKGKNVFASNVRIYDLLPERIDYRGNYEGVYDNMDCINMKYDVAILLDFFLGNNSQELFQYIYELKKKCRFFIFTIPFNGPKIWTDFGMIEKQFKCIKRIKLNMVDMIIADSYEENGFSQIKIYTVMHKPFPIPRNSLYEPIGVSGYRSDNSLSDEVGDNIAKFNSYINECTAIYWIWKHTKDEIVGINHYRRYFLQSAIWNEAKYNILDGWYIEKYLEKYDVISIRSSDSFPNSVKEALRASISSTSFEKAFNCVRDNLISMHPEYKNDFEDHFSGYTFQNCNMFICNRTLFNAYCEWLFSFLLPSCQSIDLSNEDKQSIRALGYVAERLLSLWVKHNKLSVKELDLLEVNESICWD